VNVQLDTVLTSKTVWKCFYPAHFGYLLLCVTYFIFIVPGKWCHW